MIAQSAAARVNSGSFSTSSRQPTGRRPSQPGDAAGGRAGRAAKAAERPIVEQQQDAGKRDEHRLGHQAQRETADDGQITQQAKDSRRSARRQRA